MASHLLSMQGQVAQEPMARKEPALEPTVADDGERQKVSQTLGGQTALQEHEEGIGKTKPSQPRALSDEEIAMMLHREMNVQPFLRCTSQEKKEKVADPVTSGINEQLAMLVEKITGFKCDQNA